MYFVYDHGEELIPVRPRRQASRGQRLLGTAAFCLFYGYVYYLIMTR